MKMERKFCGDVLMFTQSKTIFFPSQGWTFFQILWNKPTHNVQKMQKWKKNPLLYPLCLIFSDPLWS